MEEIKKKIHQAWVKCLLKLNILLPYGDNGARLNVSNPLAYFVVLVTMIIQYLWNVVWGLIVSVFAGLFDLVYIYTSTIRKGFEMKKAEKANEVRAQMKKVMGNVKTVKP